MKASSSGGLDEWPDQFVRALGGCKIEELRTWARRHHQRFVAVDLSACTDKPSALRMLGRALELPSWFGANLDALYDALTDDESWPIGDGAMIVLDSLPPANRFGARERDALLGVLRDVAEHHAEHETPFRVFYR